MRFLDNLLTVLNPAFHDRPFEFALLSLCLYCSWEPYLAIITYAGRTIPWRST